MVIGLTTRNVTPDIAAMVARQAVTGAEMYYPHLRTVIINADTGLKTGARDAIEAVPSTTIPILAGRYNGVMGKGAAVSAILHAALQLQAQAIIILDGNTDSITPAWIPALATFILTKQADLVKPRYYWPLPDGALSDLLFFPFTRALWGVSVRHPGAEDFALSAELARAILAQDVWETEIGRFGFDIWLSIFAVTRKWKVAQTALGTKKQPPRAQTGRTQTLFKEAVGTMFRQVQLNQKLWPNPAAVQSIPTLTEFAPAPEAVYVAPHSCLAYIEALNLGWMEYQDLWHRIITPENLAAIEYLIDLPADEFYFPPALWAKIAFDFAVVYNKGERDPDAVAACLYPLYLGRLASFWNEIAGLTAVGRAGTVSAQAVEFEELIPYLSYRWENYLPWVDSGEIR